VNFKHLGIVADHAGFEYKEKLISHLKKSYPQIKLTDFGTSNSKEKVDYPDFAFQASWQVSQRKLDGAIALCGTGIGMAIVANKLPLVQAICPWDEFSCRMGREHNNANVLCLGARTLKIELAIKILDTWINSDFAQERHQLRLEKIRLLEQKIYPIETSDDSD
jgi:RpiB/LacA/LacB family sugar-phosphate isomerase